MIIILKTLGLGYIISRFTPLHKLFEFIIQLFKKTYPTSIFSLLLIECIRDLMTCFKCLSLWIGFCLGGLWVGIICSIIAFFYDKNLSSWERKW